MVLCNVSKENAGVEEGMLYFPAGLFVEGK